ncbi:alpha/beta fold hydrolase [Halomonas desiderata]|uniref:alpha/beta fold hydrolase n=1 Tax=Billgrantia desiderata TaxID=52021 RepID=UPI00174DB3BE|nr:alpha/beta fold hydrolase [Halomonas desiderata]
MSNFRISRAAKMAARCYLVAFIVLPQVVAAGELPIGPLVGDMELSTFYRWEAMPAAPGVALRSEILQPQERMPAASEAFRILYSSVDQRWDSGLVPVSGTLFLPVGTPPEEGWPVLAWAHGTLGIADLCAPSWTGFRDRDAAYLDRWLEDGYAVVATDYQGLGGPGPHPYSYWQAEGTSVLDSIRAVQALKPRVLSDRVILAGQSQGGGAALGAAILASTYAPELNILGAVITAPNSTFPDGPIELPPRRSNTMFLSFATGGLREEGPQLDDILSAKGLELLSVARQGCTKDIALKARELNVESFQDLLAITPEELELLRVPTTDMPQASISFPLFIATGQADRTITPVRQHAVAAALCAAGNQVEWQVYEGMGHDGVMHGSLDDALAFAGSRLEAGDFASNCAALQPPGPPGERNPNALFNDD